MAVLKCTFVPQVWQGDYAYPADPLGELEWVATVDEIPDPNSYDSDDLRFSPNAPQWVQDWDGPFEVDFEEVDD